MCAQGNGINYSKYPQNDSKEKHFLTFSSDASVELFSCCAWAF